MAFVTFAERYAREQGLLTGRLETLAVVLQMKLGAEGEALVPAFHTIDDPERLQAIIQEVRKDSTLDDVRKLLSPDSPSTAT